MSEKQLLFRMEVAGFHLLGWGSQVGTMRKNRTEKEKEDRDQEVSIRQDGP